MSSHETRLVAEAAQLARAEGWQPFRGQFWTGWRQPHVGGWMVSWMGKTIHIAIRTSDAAERLIAEVRVTRPTQALDILVAYGLIPLRFASAFDAAQDPDYADQCEASRRKLLGVAGVNNVMTQRT